ncbi:MAG: RNA-directed DNA polymerase [Sphaerochaeta sp.]|nr:RNA-directed DNA polymerase [Sphaerochaeta sp.]
MNTWKDVTFKRLAKMENLTYAYRMARKRKAKRESVVRMGEPKAQKYLLGQLIDGSYYPRDQKVMVKYDGNAKKERLISCPAFRDQVVHWMLVETMRDRFMQHFIKHSVANIVGRGVGYGKKLLKHWSQQRGTKWVLELDIRKYYHNIDVDLLLDMYASKIRDEGILDLIRTILYHDSNEQKKGITLGSYFNQWCALFYLSDFDHFVKEVIQCKYYLRYVDDMVLLFPSKRKAAKALRMIESELGKLGLEIKRSGPGKVKIFRWSGHFIDMLGYRTYRNGKQTLRRNNYLSTRRLCDRIDSGSFTQKHARSLLSRKGFFQHSDCALMLDRIYRTIHTNWLKEVAICE